MRGLCIIKPDDEEIIRDLGWYSDQRVARCLLGILERNTLNIIDDTANEIIRHGEDHFNQMAGRNRLIRILADRHLQLNLAVRHRHACTNSWRCRFALAWAFFNLGPDDVATLNRSGFRTAALFIEKRLLANGYGLLRLRLILGVGLLRRWCRSGC